MKAKIKFLPEKINSCNYRVGFPEFRGQMDLSQGQTDTPVLDAVQDATFQCGMGMLHGYVKVVDELNKVDLNAVKQEVAAYRPTSEGRSCCSG
jgi:plastocyanin domain-containing protein